ncbi:predicted protein [Naegleria gruberi]|uniref:Predicted protein n=1 Tax=Naegleria gruberi TaxID=5762 RepID=D2VP50_NAEGR|nr:uncharacterized protein NAEGRDRAFT_70732 [Naegleria gruberi]EFC41296.1 predicted protein [Naegleria gruberi]|eukprot:XP_002674040.1 predicted protein [Naegleria gruberi strain NEG-M]
MIDHIDHIVLTTHNLNQCIDFYTRVLGMQLESFGNNNERKALKFGNQKINIHEYGKEFEPKAHLPVPGSIDICFIASIPLEKVREKIESENWEIIEGPILRTGAIGKITSIYIRDPDLNLVEIATYNQ